MNLFETFEMEEVFTVGDLISLGLEGLKAVGIKIGTASCLLEYAKEDV